ncbi:MAG: hypothetical protein GKR91_06810 [Pseudomonadales bacterium]|nr:hypothetical protein [Pseudomonadales bacterium]
MQQPKMIVLGLIAQGWNYGLEMKQFIEHSNMRMWAQIGSSTIYKSLRDLEAESSVTARPETAKRGPGKTVFDITEKGQQRFDDLVGEALSSQESVYSDRIAGMVLSFFLPRASARKKISACVENLEKGLLIIQAEKKKRTSEVALITLDYYRDIYRAELRALRRAHKAIAPRQRNNQKQ